MELPKHPHAKRRAALRGRGYFKRLGPGIVTGAADDDPSGIGTYSQVGAAFGLTLIWSTIFVAPMAAAVQETAARLGIATGKGLATLIKERFPRPVLYFALALVICANTFNIAADVSSMGSAANLVVPIPAFVFVVAFTALMIVLAVFLNYHHYARILRWLALSLLAYILVLGAVHVNWSDVFKNIVTPSLPNTRGQLSALIAVFGTTVSPYLFFWQASEEVEEAKDEHETQEEEIEPKHIVAMRIDVIGGMFSAVFVAFAIMVAAAVTLHSHGITNIQTSQQAAKALEPVAGHLAGLIFALGIVGLGLLAVPVLAGSTSYALAETLHWHEGLSNTFRQARGFYVVLIGSMLAGIGLNIIGIDPIHGLFLAAILNGLAAPPIIILMLLLARSQRTMGIHKSRWISTFILVVTIGISIAMPIVFLLIH